MIVVAITALVALVVCVVACLRTIDKERETFAAWMRDKDDATAQERAYLLERIQRPERPALMEWADKPAQAEYEPVFLPSVGNIEGAPGDPEPEELR